MKVRKHYLALRRCFPHIQEGVPLEITLEELARFVDCTHRNMVLLLKRMQHENWLTWLPKKGRGNRSTLIFLARKDDIVLLEAQELVSKQDLHSALNLLHSFDEESTALREQFQQWLSGQFGFSSEVQGQRRTDILRFPLPQTIHSLDPAAIHYSGESHLVNQIFDGLVRMDDRGEQPLPHLAHAWEVDESRTLWTFYLRKGVLFHHGQVMRSSDVKYSLERLQKLAPRGLYSWAYASIATIETPDDTTIRIRLAERNELFLAFLTTNRASIVPQDICEAADGQIGCSPVGTGPFKLVTHEQGIWILEAFSSYFRGRGFLDRVEVWTVPIPEKEHVGMSDQPEQLFPFQVMHNVRISDMAAEQWQQVRQSGMTTKFITVNELKDELRTNAKLREGIHLALDRAELIQRLSGDVIEAASSFLQLHEHEQKSPHEFASRGFDEIERRLKNAGYNGESLTLATIPQYETDATIIQQVCAAAGLHLNIMLIPAEEFKGEARMKADLLLFAVMLDEHRELRLIDLYKSMQQHAAPEVQIMLEHHIRLLQTESDANRRIALLSHLESQLKQRHSLLFLYRKHLKTAFHPSIRGISLDSLGWVRFRDIWFT
ncbi:ABC transporter substrate-binding protein [Paenibacillus sp. SI8]|uniref:ABC transporter substrate-binding protein n=1 Tax=unclassified Paenibacillus TaxID=185978 RepID=UPI003467881B